MTSRQPPATAAFPGYCITTTTTTVTATTTSTATATSMEPIRKNGLNDKEIFFMLAEYQLRSPLVTVYSIIIHTNNKDNNNSDNNTEIRDLVIEEEPEKRIAADTTRMK